MRGASAGRHAAFVVGCLLATAGLAGCDGGWRLPVMAAYLGGTLFFLAGIVIRQRTKLLMLDEYLAELPDLERAECEGCGSKHLVYPEPQRLYCLSCQRDVVVDPVADARAERREAMSKMSAEERIAGAVEDLQRANEWLQLVAAKSQELPGFLTIDFLASYDQENADWEDRDRHEQLSALVELATLLQDELRAADDKIDGLPQDKLPSTFAPALWTLGKVVDDYVEKKLKTKTVADLVPVLQSLGTTLEEHLALLGADFTPP